MTPDQVKVASATLSRLKWLKVNSAALEDAGGGVVDVSTLRFGPAPTDAKLLGIFFITPGAGEVLLGTFDLANPITEQIAKAEQDLLMLGVELPE